MAGHREYSDAEKRQAIRLYKTTDWGCLKISQVIGCYPSTIKRWVEKAINRGEPGLKKKPPPNYPEKFKKQVISEYLDRKDLSLRQVAEKNEISEHTLHRWLFDAGILTRGAKPVKYDRDAILEDIKSGMQKKDIAAKHGCSESWVYRVQAGA